MTHISSSQVEPMDEIFENGSCETLAVTRHPGLLLVLNTDKGRGVFAKEHIPSGTVIEVSPVLVLPPSDVPAAGKTVINHYSYNWPFRDSRSGEDSTTQAIALGLGSIFNHSRRQNVGFRKDIYRTCIVYSTLRNIEAGEELCISYGPRLWFEDADTESSAEEDNPLEDITRIEID